MHRVVVEERRGVGRLDQRRGIELAVSGGAEPVVARQRLAAQMHGCAGQVLDAGIEVGIAQVGAGKTRIRAGILVADIALAQFVIEKNALTAQGRPILERQRQGQVPLAAQGEHEGFQGVQFVVRRQAEIHAGHAA